MVSRLAPGGCLLVASGSGGGGNRGFPGFSRRGGLAFQFRLLHANLATWGWPMNNEKSETANFAFSLIWVYDQAAPPSLVFRGPFLCNRRGTFFGVRRPRKSPRTEARAEFHVAGVVRDRYLRRFNQASRGKSPLARPLAAARRSPPQPAAARHTPGRRKFCLASGRSNFAQIQT